MLLVFYHLILTPSDPTVLSSECSPDMTNITQELQIHIFVLRLGIKNISHQAAAVPNKESLLAVLE